MAQYLALLAHDVTFKYPVSNLHKTLAKKALNIVKYPFCKYYSARQKFLAGQQR